MNPKDDELVLGVPTRIFQEAGGRKKGPDTNGTVIIWRTWVAPILPSLEAYFATLPIQYFGLQPARHLSP